MAYQDLLKDTSEIKEDGNYFLVTVTDLEPAKTYPIQFRWQYKDKTFSEWSSVKKLILPGESGVPVPYVPIGNFTAAPGQIIITWNGTDTTGATMVGVDRVNVYLEDINDTFGDGSDPVSFFKEKGTISIAVPAGTYNVTLRSVTTRGTISNATTPVTLTVEGGTPIEAPTLPTGLSASSAPFALTVSWTGAYASQTFSGFKSINVYASTTNLGSSTTTNLSYKLVGSMTVDQTSNKITVGLDVLKQVLSLTSQQTYDSSIYLYYLAVNANGVPYQVGGTTTYTRINSTAIAPTKANLIDLTNGLISIENLVAGNGQFQSWLRTGTAGSSRIELSSTNVNSTEAGGYAVLSGLTVYNSANSPVFRADLSGNVAFGGYTPADIASISGTADGAAGTAGTANANASTALQKTVKLNTSGNIISPVNVPIGEGAIYSGKTSYGDATKGWYLGYNSGDAVINIGNDTNFVKWDGTQLLVGGTINATDGYIGSASNGWSINEFGIFSYGDNALISISDGGGIFMTQDDPEKPGPLILVGDGGSITVGNITMTSDSGSFYMSDSDAKDIMSTSNTGRLILGHYSVFEPTAGRQVEVARSAQVAGTANTNSRGIRNIYTISTTNFNSNTSVYLDDPDGTNGDVLLVYTP